MTELIQQRGDSDCVIAALAMFLNESYETAAARLAAVSDGADQSGDISEMAIMLTLSAAGQSSAMLVDLHVGRPALVAITSKNYVGDGHLVYWDGEAVFDPSRLDVVTGFDEMMDRATFFIQRQRDIVLSILSFAED